MNSGLFVPAPVDPTAARAAPRGRERRLQLPGTRAGSMPRSMRPSASTGVHRPVKAESSPAVATAVANSSAAVPSTVLARLAPTLQSLPPGLRTELKDRAASLSASGHLTQEALASLLMEAFARTQNIECFSL